MSDDLKSKPESYWKEQLSEEEFRITRLKETEKPFTETENHKGDGDYLCVCCKARLFSSETKYDSKSGWPSFHKPLEEENIKTQADHSLDRERTEVSCSHCGAHLGHVFDDGPSSTGKRYCINSVSIHLNKKDEKK